MGEDEPISWRRGRQSLSKVSISRCLRPLPLSNWGTGHGDTSSTTNVWARMNKNTGEWDSFHDYKTRGVCEVRVENSAPSFVDLCYTEAHNCHSNADCTNVASSFTCACNSGFSGDGLTCTDIEECTTNTHNCDAEATCTNTAGGFTCACNAGYVGGIDIFLRRHLIVLETERCSKEFSLLNPKIRRWYILR